MLTLFYAILPSFCVFEARESDFLSLIFDSLRLKINKERNKSLWKEIKACKLRLDPVADVPLPTPPPPRPKKKWYSADSLPRKSPSYKKSSVSTTTWPNLKSGANFRLRSKFTLYL